MKLKHLLLIVTLIIGVSVNSQTKKIEKEYYPNGNLKSEIETVNGLPYGYVKLFDENGILRDLTFYKSGLNRIGDSISVKHGLHKSFSESGNIFSEGKYDNNSKVGEWKEYFKNGKIKFKINFIENRQSGKFIAYYDSGTIKTKGEFVEGTKRNNWIDYYPNGNILKKYSFSEKGYETGGKTFDVNGNLEVTESHDGDFGRYQRKQYNDKGKLISLYESGGRSDIEGRLIIYHENGKIKGTGGWTRENKRNYRWRFYDENENLLAETFFEDGILEGSYEQYFPNGKSASKHYYELGLLHGLSTYYYEDGKLFTSREYVKGKLMNVIKLLNNNGDNLDFGTIKNGNGIINIYDFDGNLMSKVNVIDGVEQK